MTLISTDQPHRLRQWSCRKAVSHDGTNALQRELLGNPVKYVVPMICVSLDHGAFSDASSVFSVQAITIATRVSHNLGYSSSTGNLLISAYGIARSLGLHRIQSPPGQTSNMPHHERSTWFELIEAEVGKRTWWQLVIQDHFSISYTETYSESISS